MKRIDKARQFRAAGILAAQGASDVQAASMPTLYPEWAVGGKYGGESGVSIVQRNGSLYRCQQAHTAQAGWEPENAPALWVSINKSNAGTFADPITAARGMEYTYGLYYLDPETKKIYLCSRVGEVEGSTVVLQYLPHELEGIYFSLAS
jgi:hypothetical protein